MPTLAPEIKALLDAAVAADVPVRIYRPTTSPSAPALVWFHGGGWVLNYLDLYDACLTRLANDSGCTIVSVCYQKAPEHQFPVPFDDCYAALLWVRANTQHLQIDLAAIGVGGDSAGGNLASAVALKARDEALSPPIAFQVLAYPCNDHSMSGSSYADFAQGFGLTTRAMKWFWEQYLGADSHGTPHAYAAPLLAESFVNLPPAVMVVAECDPLASDSASYSEALRKAGVEVKLRTFEGMNHGFITMCAVTPRSHEALAWVAQEILAFIPRRA